jgi:hypothetical protein
MLKKLESEKTLERKLRIEVEKMGGLAVKFSSPFFTGMPDRIVLLSGGRMAFVELKSEGKKPTPRQNVVIGTLRALGFDVFIIDTTEGLERLLKELRNQK